MRTAFARLAATALAALAAPSAALAQQIQLDDPARAGALVFFRELGDSNRYFYVPQRARLAIGEGGLPQFSFLRYVENVRSDKETREGAGGAIVHAVVELGATDAELAEATRELRRVRPGAEVAGPAVFRSGKFALISSFREEGGDLTRQVVGLGAAPVLDGGRAAVSMRLTQLGSKILWQSFQTATPDITFQFEMELAGYRAPMRAVLEADFERIYSHRDFDLAAATPTTAAEIRDVFDDLRNQGAIKLEVVGSDDKLQSMIDYAYRKVADIMFEPVGGSGTPSPAQLGPDKGGLLDKVTKRLADARKEARDENREIRKERRQIREDANKRAEAMAARAKELTALAGKAEAQKADPELLAIVRANAAYMQAASIGAESFAASSPAGAAGTPSPVQQDLDALPKEVAVPEFAAMAVYEMRQARRSDKYRIDLNQSLPDKLPIVFAENVGDLRRYLSNASVFRSVNLDDPLYTQREVYGSFEGANADDFGKNVGFVAVQMRKVHQSGEETVDEKRIDRSSFNAAGNSFKLLYGWKGDTDRGKWLDYEYRSLWSFTDGASVEQPWTTTSFGSFPVAPPYEKRSVHFEAFDPEALKGKGVRAVIVKLHSEFGGRKKTSSATIKLSGGPAAADLDVLLPRGETVYSYEIEWMLAGNQTRRSGVQTSDSTVLFIDEMPGA